MRLALVLSIALAAGAQTGRDFLTADEVDQIRLTAEDPNVRLATYATFARLRVDMLSQLANDTKPGRSAMIHQTLTDYTKIIEAIDTVAEDALKRGKDITEGILAVADAEKQMLPALQAIEESDPKDIERYRFALTTAIETTEDSLELSEQDLGARKRTVVDREEAGRKKLEAMMTPDEVKLRQQDAKKKSEEETKQKRKAPTLRRKGETPATKN